MMVETERLTIIRSRPPASAWCNYCGGQTQMLSVDQAALRAGMRSIVIYRMVEAGKLHFMEDTEGILFICSTSLETSGSLLQRVSQMFVERDENT
jgi:hypothetical protein